MKTKIENIPAYLKDNAIWAVVKDGIPTNPQTGYGIKKDEKFSFEEIVALGSSYDYLAFKVDKSLGIGFIDLDAHTDGEAKLLRSLLPSTKRMFDSYFEISKSGKGYHILVKTDITEEYKTQANSINSKDRMPIEYYADKHWCTITGNVIDDKYELKNNDNTLNQMLSRYFSKREVSVLDNVGISEGEKIRSNESVIRLVENDKFLSNIWFNKISNIMTRKGTLVSYNNHTADFILIRGIMFYANANKEQAYEVYKCSPKYKAYPKGYKREVDITNALNDSLKSLNSVMDISKSSKNIEYKSVEERAVEIEEKLSTLSEEEEQVMNKIDSLLNITEEEKADIPMSEIDVRAVQPYLTRISNLNLRDILVTYVSKCISSGKYLIHFMPDSELYTTSIADLAKLTKYATNNEIFYSKSMESFMRYNGKFWEETDDSMLLSEVHKALTILYDNTFKCVLPLIDKFKELDFAVEAYKNMDEEDKDSSKYERMLDKYSKESASMEKFILSKYSKITKILESNKTPSDVLAYMQSDISSDFVRYEDTDYLNFQNGTLNLRTGEFKDFDKDDRLTNILGCSYDPSAECPNFDKFANSLFNTEDTKIQLLRAFASCLIKDASPKHKKFFFLLQGPTGSGKTTLINSLLALMGTYGTSSKYQTFMKTNKEYSGASHNQDIYELIGKQFITCSEPSDTSVFAADFLKAFTGGSNLSIRAAYGHKFVNFKNTGLLFIDSNFAPKIATFDQAAMDRFQVFPMVKIPEENERDNNLGSKLNSELSGIFNRIYEQLKNLDNAPFTPSREMEDYKNQYKEESSDIMQWYIESLKLTDTNTEISFNKLYNSFEGWCKVNNKKPLTRAFLSNRIKEEIGITSYKHSGQSVIAGYVFTEVGSVYSEYNNYEKKSEFYKALDKVTRPEGYVDPKELTYRSLRQQILSKTAPWFANSINVQGDLKEQKNKYPDYVQYCVWNLSVPLCKQDFSSIVEYMLTELKVADIVKMANGEFDAKMLLADAIRKISIVHLETAA